MIALYYPKPTRPFSITIFLILIYLFSSLTNAWGQTRAQMAEEVEEEIWGLEEDAFQNLEVPSKWQDESAVIIARWTQYEYGKRRGFHFYKRAFQRERIKLLDQYAVDTYSEFSWQDFAETFGNEPIVGIKVVKPDGSEQKVDTEEAVTMAIQQGFQEASYQKIAIPNLEPGDILDYYVFSRELLDPVVDFLHIEPITYFLQGVYPINQQKLVIAVDTKTYLNARSLNQAPALKYDEDYLEYSLEYGQAEKIKGEIWAYPERTIPLVKFQAFFKEEPLLGQIGEAKTEINSQDILKYFQEISMDQEPYSKFLSYFDRYLAIAAKKSLSPLDKIEEAYGFYKNYYLIDQLVYAYENDELISDWLLKLDFIQVFSKLLETENIDFELITALPRSVASIQDWILPQEQVFLIRINQGETFFLAPPLMTDGYKAIPYEVEGTQAYAINPKNQSFQSISLPITSPAYNSNKTHLDISLEDEKILQIRRKQFFTGANKESYQSLLVRPTEKIFLDYQKYQILLEGKSKVSEQDLNNLFALLSQASQPTDTQTKDALKGFIQNEFDFKVAEILNYKILQLGLESPLDTFAFEDEFSTQDLIKKIANNLLLEVGKLIGRQVEIDENAKQRQQDIYMPYPRTYENNLSIQIPETYEVQGLDKLNYQVSNQTGSFQSIAEQRGQKIYIQTIKTYQHNYENINQWSQILEFLEAAYTFSQGKILFKKKN